MAARSFGSARASSTVYETASCRLRGEARFCLAVVRSGACIPAKRRTAPCESRTPLTLNHPAPLSLGCLFESVNCVRQAKPDFLSAT